MERSLSSLNEPIGESDEELPLDVPHTFEERCLVGDLPFVNAEQIIGMGIEPQGSEHVYRVGTKLDHEPDRQKFHQSSFLLLSHDFSERLARAFCLAASRLYEVDDLTR